MSKRKIINAVLDIEGAAVLWAPMTVILFFFMFGLSNDFTMLGLAVFVALFVMAAAYILRLLNYAF